jgi:hypothetical protein
MTTYAYQLYVGLDSFEIYENEAQAIAALMYTLPQVGGDADLFKMVDGTETCIKYIPNVGWSDEVAELNSLQGWEDFRGRVYE